MLPQIVTKIKVLFSNKSIRNGLLFAIFSFINKGFGFLLLLILANFITPEEYGFLSLYTTVIMIVSYFIALSSEGYLEISFFQYKKNGVKQTFSMVFVISTIIATLLVVFISLDIEQVYIFLSISKESLYICIFTCYFTVFFNLLLSIYRVSEKVLNYGIASCACVLLNFVLSIVLVKYCSLSWYGRVYSQAICYFLFGTFGLIYFLKNKQFTFHFKDAVKPILLWSIPLIPHLATNFIRGGCDRYIINYFHTTTDVGIFSFAYTLASIIVMLGTGFNQSNSVEIFKILGKENLSAEIKKNKILRQNKIILKLIIATVIAIVIACFIAIPFLFPKYSDSLPYFAILTLYGLGVCYYLLYTNILFFYKKTKIIMYITFFSATLHLLVSLIFTRYSLYLTCLTYVVSQAIVVVMIKIIANNELEKNINQQEYEN